jgi:NTP pyrophosphatase (non-canonical NTP hydrolase)
MTTAKLNASQINVRSILKFILGLNDQVELTEEVEDLIANLRERGYDNRDRLFRKLVEETGEYAEAIEYNNGSTKKVEKFKGKATPQEKLEEEIVDIFMIAVALGQLEGLRLPEMLKRLRDKLAQQKFIHESRLTEKRSG